VGGSYHFSRPDLNPSLAGAVAEADWYLSRHDPAVFRPDVPWIFVHDAESNGGSNDWVRTFQDHVSQRIGYRAWLYSYPNWISTRGITPDLDPLWIAAPSDTPGSPRNMGWSVVTAHQYGLDSHGVDADLFLGDRAALMTLAGVVTQPPDPPRPHPPVIPPPRHRRNGMLTLTFDTYTLHNFWVDSTGKLRHAWWDGNVGRWGMDNPAGVADLKPNSPLDGTAQYLDTLLHVLAVSGATDEHLVHVYWDRMQWRREDHV
jgi:hypothetical protein